MQEFQFNTSGLTETRSSEPFKNNNYVYVSPEGYKLEYNDTGQGRTILFLHGALSNINTWRKIIPSISKAFRCISINLPLGGHRIPIETKVDLSPTGIAFLINEILDHLKIENTILVANDTGGAYAQVFTAEYPEKVEKLILSNCEALEVFPPAKFAYLKYAVKIPGFTWLMGRVFSIKKILKNDKMLGLLSLNLSNEEFHKFYIYTFITNSKIRKNFKQVAKTWSPAYTLYAAEKLRNYKKPVLILWGNQDFELFPLKLGIRLKNIFPNSSLIEIKNSRTYIQEDQPEQTAFQILKFLTQ